MNEDYYHTCIPIPFEDDQIRSFTFDGCCYYFVYSDYVLKTDRELRQITSFQTNRMYDFICYDAQEDCFWGMVTTNSSIIFRLDKSFCECNYIKLKDMLSSYGSVSGLSYNTCEQCFVLAIDNAIYQFNKEGCCMHQMEFQNGIVYGVSSLSPGCILYMSGSNGCSFQVLNPEGRRHKLQSIQEDVQVIAMLIDTCCQKDVYYLRYLALGDTLPLSLCEVKLTASILGYQPCKCNQQYCENGDNSQEMDCIQILESIALEEAALAHILNAEGEKIQKAVAISENIESMLIVNQSVNETIVNTTALEQTLYAKLLALSKLYDINDCANCSCNNKKC